MQPKDKKGKKEISGAHNTGNWRGYTKTFRQHGKHKLMRNPMKEKDNNFGLMLRVDGVSKLNANIASTCLWNMAKELV